MRLNIIKNVLMNLIIVLISTVMGFFICELGLRLYYFRGIREPMPEITLRKPHPTFGWSLIANKIAFQQTLDYTTHIRINSKGLRDVEHTYKKQPQVFRIVVLGDSFMEAYQVQFEDMFTRVLQRELNRNKSIIFEVINLGIGGFGTTQEYLYLKDEGLKYDPDLVILSFLAANDVRNNYRPLEIKLWRNENDFKIVSRPFFEINENGNLVLITPNYSKALELANLRKTRLLKTSSPSNFYDKMLTTRLMQNKINAISAMQTIRKYDLNAMLGVYFPKYDKHWENAWNVTKQVILKTNELVRSQNADFLVVEIQMMLQIDEDYFEKAMSKYKEIDKRLRLDLEKPSKILLEFCNMNRISCISLLEDFRSHYKFGSDKLYHSIKDHHWNRHGHKLAADIVAKYIKEKYIQDSSL